MSGDVNHGAEPESGGTVNPGFDPLGAGDLDSHSHGGTQLTDWKNFADKTLEEYLVNCPGTHGVPLPSTGLAAGQEDPSVNKQDGELSSSDSDNEFTGPQEPSENKEEYVRYVFHLYVEQDVESVKLLTDKPMRSDCVTMSLHCCSGDRKYWKSLPLFLHANEEDTFRYRYIVKYKEGLTTWLLKKVTFSRSKDEKTIKETNARKLNRGNNQFDIFHHPSNLNWKGSVFSGQLFFVKLLYEELGSGGNFKELLMECRRRSF